MTPDTPTHGPAEALWDADPDTSVDDLGTVLKPDRFECGNCGHVVYTTPNFCGECGQNDWQELEDGGEK